MRERALFPLHKLSPTPPCHLGDAKGSFCLTPPILNGAARMKKREIGASLTSPTPFKPRSKSTDLERIFLDHYDWLLGWARQLTRGTSEDAEDLVQDFYVRFVQMKSSPTFSDEDHTRAYLYKALKNMFVSRKMRQGRDAISGLSVVDFDSVEAAVASVDRSQLLYVRSDLAAICEYAIIRRKTNKAAAAFTLRYFFGYLPSEVASLLRVNRATLDAFLQTARLEARAYLTRPGVLRFLDRREKKVPAFPRHLPERSDELFIEIQRRILADKEGDCLTRAELSDLYDGEELRPLSLKQAAHLVSCSFCLSNVIRLLELPDLLLQFGDGGIGESGEGGGSGDDGVAGSVTKLRRKLREVYEHRPKKLQIAVDGQVRGIQTVTGAINNVQIKLQPLQQPSFIEVLSEQGVGLLYLDVQETPGVPESHAAAVDLSDGRQLSVSLVLSGDAHTVEVYYYDPLFGAEFDEPPSAPAPTGADSVSMKNTITRWSIFCNSRRSLYWEDFHHFLRRFRVLSIGMCLLFVAVVGAIGGLNWIRVHNPAPVPPAASLLALSASRDQGAIPAGGSVRRTFSLTVESLAGKVLQSGQVSYLRQATPSRSAIELHSPAGKLLAGRWVNSEGKINSYPLPKRNSRPSDGGSATLIIPDWQKIPDATSFRELSSDDTALTAHRSGNDYVIGFNQRPLANTPTIIEADLVLTGSNLHPVAQTFVVQSGELSQKYIFKEVRYQLLRSDQVDNRDFEPPHPVVSGPTSFADTLHSSNSHLLLAVLKAVSAYGPETERAVDVERGVDGRLLVSGVLSSERQRLDLTRLLRNLQAGSRIQLALHSTDEPLPSSTHTSAAVIRQTLAISDTPIPMGAYLRQHIATHVGTPAETEQSIRDTSNLIVEEGSHLRRETWWLGQIGGNYFSKNDLHQMSLSDQRSWLDLLAHHLNNCSSGLIRLRSDLFIPDEGSTLDRPSFRNADELASSTKRLALYGEHLDQLLQNSFTVSTATEDTLHAPEEFEQLLAEMDREERSLHATVEYLQQRQLPSQPR